MQSMQQRGDNAVFAYAVAFRLAISHNNPGLAYQNVMEAAIKDLRTFAFGEEAAEAVPGNKGLAN